jgi:hypothetical protein
MKYIEKKYFCVVPILMILSWVSIGLRSPSVFHFNKIMFMEDIPIFFNQANEYGFRSLFMTSARYEHFILRVVAWIASFFKDQYAPNIYMFAVIFGFSLIIMTTYKQLNFLCRSQRILVALSILCIPSGRALYDNLTYFQWTLAIALSILVLSDWSKYNTQLRKIMFVVAAFLLCLQGPFGVILLPVILLKLLLYKDLRKNLFAYLALILSSAVQFCVMIMSNPQNNLTNIPLILKIFLRNAIGEITKWPIVSYAIVIYILYLIICRIKVFKTTIQSDRRRWLFLVLGLLFFSFMIMFSSIAKHARWLHEGYQYAHNFYYAIMVTFIVLSTTKRQKIISLLFFLLMLYSFPKGLELTNSFWDSHVAFKQRCEYVKLRNGWFHWNLGKDGYTKSHLVLEEPDRTIMSNSGLIESEYLDSNHIGFYAEDIVNKDVNNEQQSIMQLAITNRNGSSVNHNFGYALDEEVKRMYFAIPVSELTGKRWEIQYNLPVKINVYYLK